MWVKILLKLLLLTMFIGSACAFETLTKDNFAEPVIEPKLKDYYMSGEQISFNFTILPKTDEDAKLIGGTSGNPRLYEFNTSLDSSTITVMVSYTSGGGATKKGDNYLAVDVYGPEGGVSKINVKISGVVPSISIRVSEIVALAVDIQDAEENAIRPVKIKVINENAFSKDISELEEKYKHLVGKVDELENKGVSVSDLRVKLKNAKEKIDEGKSYYSSKKYLDADKSLSNAENLLNKAEMLIEEKKISFLIDETKNKLNEMFTKMAEFEVIVNNLKSKGEPTLEYETKLATYKQYYLNLNTKIESAEDYLNKGLYDEAKIKAEEVNKKANQYISEIESIIASLQQKTPTQAQGTFGTNFFEGFTEWLNKNRDKLITYGGGAVGLLIVVFVVYKGVKRYMKRRKWDELK